MKYHCLTKNNIIMKKLFHFLLALAIVPVFISCASILGGGSKKVTFNTRSDVGPVLLSIDGKEKEVYLPHTEKVKGGFKSTEVVAVSDDNRIAKTEIKKKLNNTTWANILIGGVPGVLVDCATGAIMKPSVKECWLHFKDYDSKEVVEKKKIAEQEAVEIKKDPTIVAGAVNERVSRDNPGGTALERSIIRWYFDSDPRGARISYRVISSIPSEVKNTNETYLTTTPYEETKSFNILGLTYANSRDVTIEIKISKRGYEDQIKRYNVRQAIDQQEISGFFELVSKE